MRVLLQGGSEGDRGAIAEALRRGGCSISDGGEGFDCALTVSGGGATMTEGIAIDPANGTVTVAGRVVRLSRTELALVACLARLDRPVARSELLETVWGYRFDPGTNVVAVHICRLRAKLGQDWVEHGRGGYRLARQVAGPRACALTGGPPRP